MEARPRKDGRVAYRYHPAGSNPVALGTDKVEAIRRVLDLLGKTDDTGTFTHVWRLLRESARWREIADKTRTDYESAWHAVERVFGSCALTSIEQPDIRRYMVVERGGRRVANTEVTLMSLLYKVAIDHAIARHNPCYGIERIKVKARKSLPIESELGAFLTWLRNKGKQWGVIAAMAEFAARSGSRRCEFLRATEFQIEVGAVRLRRAKQRDREVYDIIELSHETIQMLRSIRRDDSTSLFPTRAGRPYTDSGFTTMWRRAREQATAEGVITQPFTFHDLRAYYVTLHERERGELPKLHRDPGVTGRIYNRAIEIKRSSV